MPEPNHIICNSIELKHCSIVTNTLYEGGDWFQHVTIVLFSVLMNVYILISHDCIYIVVCRGTLVLEDLNILWVTRDHRVKVKYHHLLEQLIVACLIQEHHLKQWSLVANLKIHYLQNYGMFGNHNGNTRVWNFDLLDTACSGPKMCGPHSECVGRGSMAAVHCPGGILTHKNNGVTKQCDSNGLQNSMCVWHGNNCWSAEWYITLGSTISYINC